MRSVHYTQKYIRILQKNINLYFFYCYRMYNLYYLYFFYMYNSNFDIIIYTKNSHEILIFCFEQKLYRAYLLI